MKAKRKKTLPRRDLVAATGRRALLMASSESRTAWFTLAKELTAMEEMDMPKFKHLLRAIRKATIAGKQHYAISAQ